MSFEYHQPTTTEEALELATRFPEAEFIAGGTDLMVRMREDRRGPPALISLRRVKELAHIEDGQYLRLGATVPLRDVAAHPVIFANFPALVESIRVFGSPQIRNVATLGGNLCNASPGADCAPPLLIYQARVELCSNGSRRELSVEDFILGPGETSLRPGEMLTAILLERPAEGAHSTYLRKGRVQMDLAIASVAALVEMDGPTCIVARLAAGAVAPVPCRLERVEAIIECSDLRVETRALARSAAQTEISPISDVRASAEYRRHLTGVFVERSIAILAASAAIDRGQQ
jgi:carbon-monoxide dehydrogenase medium subunit